MNITFMSQRALLFSGGLDSYCAHLYLKHKGISDFHDLVNIYVGTETNRREIARMGMLVKQLNLGGVKSILGVDLETVEQTDGFVPLRNLLLVGLPVMHRYDTVYLAAVKGEGSLDKTYKFAKDTSDLFSYLLGRRISIQMPVAHMTKTELVRWVLDNGATTEEKLSLTTSCYRPDNALTGRCGECQACVRRWVAMMLNDIYEPHDTDPFFKARELVNTSHLRKILTQPLGRWPDVVLTNKELRDAVVKVERNLYGSA